MSVGIGPGPRPRPGAGQGAGQGPCARPGDSAEADPVAGALHSIAADARVARAEEALRQAEDVFELLMGSTVGPRREFIVEESAGLDRMRIDA